MDRAAVEVRVQRAQLRLVVLRYELLPDVRASGGDTLPPPVTAGPVPSADTTWVPDGTWYEYVQTCWLVVRRVTASSAMRSPAHLGTSPGDLAGSARAVSVRRPDAHGTPGRSNVVLQRTNAPLSRDPDGGRGRAPRPDLTECPHRSRTTDLAIGEVLQVARLDADRVAHPVLVPREHGVGAVRVAVRRGEHSVADHRQSHAPAARRGEPRPNPLARESAVFAVRPARAVRSSEDHPVRISTHFAEGDVHRVVEGSTVGVERGTNWDGDARRDRGRCVLEPRAERGRGAAGWRRGRAQSNVGRRTGHGRRPARRGRSCSGDRTLMAGRLRATTRDRSASVIAPDDASAERYQGEQRSGGAPSRVTVRCIAAGRERARAARAAPQPRPHTPGCGALRHGRCELVHLLQCGAEVVLPYQSGTGGRSTLLRHTSGSSAATTTCTGRSSRSSKAVYTPPSSSTR